MTARMPLILTNADTATFECTFGRGCEGICCQNGRPSLSREELARIKKKVKAILPLLRPKARATYEASGYVSQRTKLGQPMARVVDGWCIFFNNGCVLHKLGADEGDFTQYKPVQCILFPLEHSQDGTWYVRQWGLEDEQWDLFCLNPKNTKLPAVQTLAEEIAFAARNPQ